MDDHAPSLWAATRVEEFSAAPLVGDLETDVAVVGGGYLGCAAALQLARDGVAVTLVEAETIGWGASGRNAGFVVPNFIRAEPQDVIDKYGAAAGERLLHLIGTAADQVFDLIKAFNIQCQAAQAGWLQPAHSKAMADRLRERVRAWAARDRPVEYLGPAETARITGAQGYFGALLDRSGGSLQPLDYALGLARAAAASGARIFERTPVRRLTRDGKAWRLTSPRGGLRAGAVLLCTNAHGGSLSPDLRRSILPLAIHQIATAPLGEADRRRLLAPGKAMSDTRANLFAYRQTPDGRLIAGHLSALPWGATRRARQVGASRLVSLLGLKSVPQVDFAWSGQAALTRDFLPRLYQAGPDLYAGIGCNGRGIAMTTVLGRVMAQAAQGRPHHELAVPVTEPEPIPLHWLARQGVRLALPYYRWRDRRESS